MCLASVNHTLDRFAVISKCRKKEEARTSTFGLPQNKLANSRKLSLRFSYLFFRLFARPEWLISRSHVLSRCWKSPADGVVVSSVFAGVVGGVTAIAANTVVRRPNKSRIENLSADIDGPKKGERTIGKGKSAAGWA